MWSFDYYEYKKFIFSKKIKPKLGKKLTLIWIVLSVCPNLTCFAVIFSNHQDREKIIVIITYLSLPVNISSATTGCEVLESSSSCGSGYKCIEGSSGPYCRYVSNFKKLISNENINFVYMTYMCTYDFCYHLFDFFL